LLTQHFQLRLHVTGEMEAMMKNMPPMAPQGVQLTDRFGSTFYVGVGPDVLLPAFPIPQGTTYRDSLTAVKNMELRDGDVLLCSYPKTGTHWTGAIISKLVAGSVDDGERQEGLLEMGFTHMAPHIPSPRILGTHLPVRWLPKEVLEKKIKIVLCNRNPKDQIVSMFYHLTKMRGELGWDGDFASYFWHRMEMGGVYGDMLDYYMDWQNFQDANPSVAVHECMFEEMKLDEAGAVRGLNDFLQTGCSDELCAAIASACSFGALKAAKDQKESAMVKALFKDGKPGFYRKGDVGDWRTHMTVAMNEHFDAVLASRMADYRRTYKYTL